MAAPALTFFDRRLPMPAVADPPDPLSAARPMEAAENPVS
jgi:hypothetical protein